MFGPYRTPPEREAVAPPRATDARVIAWILVVVGCARVAVAVATRDVVGLEPPAGLAIAAIGVGLLARRARVRGVIDGPTPLPRSRGGRVE